MAEELPLWNPVNSANYRHCGSLDARTLPASVQTQIETLGKKQVSCHFF